ncbi:superinfection immunity protein [Acetobacter sp.]|uniref:superinfection immunity protein n=1 Tax=Acetobacter sp. TaxID=440 RepID=UPI0039ECCD57
MTLRQAVCATTALMLLTGALKARGATATPPLAHADLNDQNQIAISAAGINAAIDLRQQADCNIPTLLNTEDSFPSGACRMATLTVTDTSHPNRPPFVGALTPYNRDASDVRDMQLELRRLDANTPLPQAITSIYTGGAHCCAITSVVGTATDGTWTATRPSELAGEGRPRFIDLDGDSASEIITGDESFLYTFASHAGSYIPDIIYRYVGGRLVNVTRDAPFRPYLEQELKENEGFWTQQNRSEPNGFLAYYVAMKALMGQFAAGWTYMLPRYDHEIDSGFSLSLCTIGGRMESECSEDERAPLPFPQALAGFLVAQGYVSPQEALTVAPDAEPAIHEASRYHPDFSCLTPPQKNGVALALCENSSAAEHQLAFDRVYYALRQAVGPEGWKGLRQEIVLAENAIDQECQLPIPGADDQTVSADAMSCYAAAMDRLAEKYRARLSGAALEESQRPIDEHIALQRRLITLGYMPARSTADGVYGEATRAAIAQWKRDTQRPDPTPFLSDADAAVLLGHPVQTVAVPPKAEQPQTAKAPALSPAPATSQPASKSLFGLPIALAVLLLASGFAIYFVPFIMACLRDTIRKPAVFAVNFFLGWTLIGWVAALVMAFSLEGRPTPHSD